MISKNSFLVNMRENNKRRSWVWAISALFWFFYYPVATAILMSGKKNHNIIDNLSGTVAKERLAEAAGQWLSADILVMTFVGILAIVCAIHGFSYLYSRKKVDLYHSVPVSKRRRFAVIYVNGVLIFFLPYLLNVFLGILVAGINGGMNVINVKITLISVLMNLILYLGVYSLTIIAVMMTGNIVMTLLGTAIFLGYELAVRMLMTFYQSAFFQYYHYRYDYQPLSSPIGYYIEAVQHIESTNSSFMGVLTPMMKCMVLAILFGTLAYAAYRRRPSEAAGKSMAFSVTKAAIKTFLVVPFTLFVGITVRDIVGADGGGKSSAVILLFVMAAAAIIGSCLIEVIYELDIRAALRKKHQILIIGACTAIIYSIFQFDLTGFDKWTPNPEKLEEATVIISGLTYRQTYVDEELRRMNPEEYVLQMPGITDIEAICELSEKKAEHENKNIQGENSYLWMDVAYRMKSGRVIWRSFAVDAREEAVLNKIMSNEEFKRANYQIYEDAIFDRIKGKDSYQILYHTGISAVNLSPDDTDLIRQLYIKDLENTDYTKRKDEFICGTLEFSVRSGSYMWFEYDIYPSYTNIIGYLKEKGLYEEMTVKAQDIASITVTNNHYEMYSVDDDMVQDYSITKTFSEEEQIGELVDALYPASFDSMFKMTDTISTDYYVYVQLKNGTNNSNYYRGDSGFYLITEKIPDWLVRETAYE